MSDIIHLLPDSVANQIAAGEVIQRPASVIKELVENAVDAGAKHIDVILVDAGRTSIQVIDDGKGMSETDARLAFERHATSKISEASDLFALRTMGFRGEALASIAAVAQVELRTRQADSELGTCITIAGSQLVGQEVVSCAEGSSFTVKNLFFNVPARRKFLKSNQTELNNILQEFERIVLVHPDIAFTLNHNGVNLMTLPICSLRQRIVGVFGKKMNEQLLSVEVDTTLVHLSGFVGKPEASRRKGAHQFFFVNGRYMRHNYFHKAVSDAYEQLIPVGEQVPYFLYFDVAPANIDVNIHPAKTEIKFENEAAIWQIIGAAIRESLGKFNAVPTIDFNTEDCPDIPVFGPDFANVEQPKVQVNPNYNPFKDSSSSSAKSQMTNWESLYEGMSVPQRESNEFPMSEVYEDAEESFFASGAFNVEPELKTPTLLSASESEKFEKSTQHYQHKGQYIITSVKSGLMIIDHRRAHIRILYERFKRQMASHTGVSQGLLFPEMIQLSVSDALLLEELTDELQAIGFDLASLGNGCYSIKGVPAGIEGLNPCELLHNIIACAKDGSSNLDEEIQHRVALTMARNAAIVVGQVLSNEEMEDLIGALFACENPNYTPDGKPTTAILPQENIEKLFR